MNEVQYSTILYYYSSSITVLKDDRVLLSVKNSKSAKEVVINFIYKRLIRFVHVH